MMEFLNVTSIYSVRETCTLEMWMICVLLHNSHPSQRQGKGMQWRQDKMKMDLSPPQVEDEVLLVKACPVPKGGWPRESTKQRDLG
jgi:hypothetical protein